MTYQSTISNLLCLHNSSQSILSHNATNIANLFLNQRTPLHIAVREGQEYTVKSLVKKGADIDFRDNDGVSKTGSRLVPLGRLSLIPSHHRY